ATNICDRTTPPKREPNFFGGSSTLLRAAIRQCAYFPALRESAMSLSRCLKQATEVCDWRMNRLCPDIEISIAHLARLIALAIMPLGCGVKLSPFDGWIWESTECSDQCSIASSSSIVETLSFAGDRATFAELSGGCSLTVTDIPVVLTSE